MLVGYPGSGKSFLANQIEKKSAQRYVTVCRDILGTWQKCAAKATELIKVGIFNIIHLVVTRHVLRAVTPPPMNLPGVKPGRGENLFHLNEILTLLIIYISVQ